MLLLEGQVCDRVYFIEEGLARAFYLKDEEDITSWFMPENNMIISVRRFFRQEASYESIELLEDCRLTSIKFQDLQFLYRQFPEFNFVGRVLTEQYYVMSEERALYLRKQRVQDRFQALQDSFPQIFNRAPLKHIASYLGMNPETLSRLRSSIR